MKFLINIVIFIMKIIYFFIKLFPQRNVVTIISWQSNEPSLDIKLLKRDLKKELPKYEVKILCKKLEGNILQKFMYAFQIVKQMYFISISKVIVLDSYCIPVSVLKHKKNLKVIQMWHAIGLMKKAGYSILEKNEGRSLSLAIAAKMHRNYDIAIASSDNCINAMSEVFDIDKSKILVAKLPRVDYILTQGENVRKKIYNLFPEIKNKKNVLYVPTHRKNEDELLAKVNDLIKKFDFSKYNLIIKLHPLSKIKKIDNRVLNLKEISTIDSLFIADIVVSDYSAICYEAMLLKIPVYYYAFDLNLYEKERDFFIEYKKELNTAIAKTAQKLIKNIETNHFNFDCQNSILKKYVDVNSCKVIEVIKSDFGI